MKTILYATDYSQNSVTALHFAHSIGGKLKAQLIVMHVFDIPISLVSPASISYIRKRKKLFVDHRVKLENFCSDHLGNKLHGTDIKIVVDEDGSVTEGIVKRAIKYNADLVVVGTKGASVVREFILGSTAKALIRKAPCTVLTVPEKSVAPKFGTMVYASDFEQADIFAIRKMITIAKPFRATIKVVHIITRKEYSGDQQMVWFKEMLKQKVEYNKIEFNLIYSDTILIGLKTFLKDTEADVLAMLERGDQGIFSKLFHGDLVTKMESDISIPLLSFTIDGLLGK